MEPSPESEAQTQAVHEKVLNATARAVDNPTREGTRTRLEWLMYDPSVVTDELVETRYCVYTQPAFLAIVGRLLHGLAGGPSDAETMTAERLGAISSPTLVLWTRQNPTMPWEVGEAAAKLIPGSKFQLMEDTGHWPQFERPAEFHDAILGFLANS